MSRALRNAPHRAAIVCDIFGGDPDPEALPVSVLAELSEQHRQEEMDAAPTRSEIERAASGVGCVRCGDEEAPTEYGLCANCEAMEADVYFASYADRIPPLLSNDAER
jgi:hypothetical protein